jgi:putative membrane protein
MPSRLGRSAVGAALALVAIAVSACKEGSKDATSPEDVAGGIAKSVRSDADILGLLKEANRAEIAAGQLAALRSSNTDVKSFGTNMVTEHTALDATADGVAAQLKLTPTMPNDDLAREQNAEISGISGLGASNFGFHYMSMQVTAHQRTLALIDAFIAKAQAASLRTSLQNDVRPHIVVHLAAAQQLKARVSP